MSDYDRFAEWLRLKIESLPTDTRNEVYIASAAQILQFSNTRLNDWILQRMDECAELVDNIQQDYRKAFKCGTEKQLWTLVYNIVQILRKDTDMNSDRRVLWMGFLRQASVFYTQLVNEQSKGTALIWSNSLLYLGDLTRYFTFLTPTSAHPAIWAKAFKYYRDAFVMLPKNGMFL